MMGDARELFYVDDNSDDVFLAEYDRRRKGLSLILTSFLSPGDMLACLDQRLSDCLALPAMIVADLYMPGMDGSALIGRIRRRPAFDGILLAICSGSEDPGDRAKSIAAGADHVLLKPLDLLYCLELIRAAGNQR